MNWPYVTDGQNLYVFQKNDARQCFEVKGIPIEGMALRPHYEEQGDVNRLLDEVVLNCVSEEDFFQTIMNGVSPAGMPSVRHPSELKDNFVSKRAFFKSLRDQAEDSGVTTPQYVSLSSSDYNYTIADLLAAFNIKTVALLSLPAYAAMDLNGGFLPIAPDDPDHDYVMYPCRDFAIPSWSNNRIRCFEDYFRAFVDGTFLNNNSDMFITLYGLAVAIDIFVNQFDWEGLDNFEDLIQYEPLNRTLNALVRMGALHSPFDTRVSWEYCPSGINNAKDVNPDLAGTLELVRMVQPIPLSPFMKSDVVQVFYGLIKHFPLKDYFGIDFKAKFEFPGFEPSMLKATDNGPKLRWERHESRYGSFLGARALLPGSDLYAEYSPCDGMAPTIRFTIPLEGGAFRIGFAYIWNVPEDVLNMESHAIAVRGIKQILDSVDARFADEVEAKFVYNKDGIQILNCNDFEDYLVENDLLRNELGKKLGVEDVDKATLRKIQWEPVFDEGEVVGYRAALSDGISVLHSYPKQYLCPRITCLQKESFRSGECYAWDIESAVLKDGDGHDYEALGLKQLCESKGLNIIDELQQHAFSYLGLAVIPKGPAAELFHDASGEYLNLFGKIGGLYGD